MLTFCHFLKRKIMPIETKWDGEYSNYLENWDQLRQTPWIITLSLSATIQCKGPFISTTILALIIFMFYVLILCFNSLFIQIYF